MTDEVTFYVYERVKECDIDEIQHWEEIFAEESGEYERLFKGKLESCWRLMQIKKQTEQ